MLSPDEKRLYFISNKSIDNCEIRKDSDIWYLELQNGEWSQPINAGSTINSKKDEYYVSFSENGNLYFSSNRFAEDEMEYNFDVYSATLTEDTFSTPKRLNSNINTKQYEADVFISPDDSYLIYCAKYKDGFGKGDLYISFKNEEEKWKPAINIGSIINSNNHELCPFVSKDGKYLFYTSDQDIYWVSTALLKKLKQEQ